MTSVRRLSATALLAVSTLLAGCAALPSSGPTAGKVIKRANDNEMGFAIVDIDPAVVQRLNATAAPPPPGLSQMAATSRNDAIGPGDVLLINVFEVGASLFNGSNAIDTTAGAEPGARNATFPPVTVDRAGAVTLPFIGRLVVAGRTPAEVQHQIEQGLAGKSQNPQVIVSVRDNIANRVFVGGDVHRPGPIELTLGDERVTDAIAIAQGPAFTSDDMIVRLHRNGRTGEEHLAELIPGSTDDVKLIAGDRIEVLHRPRSFTVFGATTNVSQVSFENSEVSLAEALARVGGPNDAQADPKGIFLFRYSTSVSPQGIITQPVIYRLNMMEPQSYFIAQKFAMKDKDVLYIANAQTVAPSKFVAILSQLISPVITARALSR